MSTTRRLVVVSAGLSQPSSTRLLADRLASATSAALQRDGRDVEIDVLDLRGLAHEITDAMLTGFHGPRLAEAVSSLERADGIIAATPVFTASVSGLFKSFLDVLDPAALAGAPVIAAATGGSERHSLVLDHAMRPVFAYLRAIVMPTGVYAASSDWGSDAAGGGLAARIERAAGELADAMLRSDRSQREDAGFTLPAGFDPSGLTAAG